MKALRVILSILMGTMFSTAFAQQSATPSSGDGASLTTTMQFIQDQMNEQGRIDYTLHTHDNAQGTDWPVYQIGIEPSHAVADAAGCRITWHKRLFRDGKMLLEKDITLDLRSVVKVEVRTSIQEAKAEDTANGHPEFDKRQDPPYFVVVPVGTESAGTQIFVSTEDRANRIAKALRRAVMLCSMNN
jgi:hypothetical protein